MFRGASSLNMDSKGRLGVPTKYRDPLRERCAGKLVLTVNNTRERCLWLYPYDEWEQVERKVVDLPSFDVSAQALKRFLIGYATDCELDSAGRVRVSAPLREFAGLDKRVVMIGQGNKFEIWDESCWNKRCDEWLVKEPEPGPLPVELETLSL
ncbi:MAG: division/cell wall cluster transcriptional repressor MraZ [Pseudomonadota bacterium]|nr:division/cell wall cluster transcriptional repressor MraZ [Pseudomonadota bacterium]